MAANPLPLLALGAAALFLMKKKDEAKTSDEPSKPSTNGTGTNGSGQNGQQTTPDNGQTGQDKLPPSEEDPGWSDYGDGSVEIISERQFNEVDNGNPVEFKPNKQGEALLFTNIDTSWTYEMRFPAELAGTESDFAEIMYDSGNLLWVSTAGARPLEELKLEGIPDPDQPNQRVLLAWM